MPCIKPIGAYTAANVCSHCYKLHSFQLFSARASCQQRHSSTTTRLEEASVPSHQAKLSPVRTLHSRILSNILLSSVGYLAFFLQIAYFERNLSCQFSLPTIDRSIQYIHLYPTQSHAYEEEVSELQLDRKILICDI